MKAVIFDRDHWHKKLWPQIMKDNGEAVRISWVCKERLGFTVREHRAPISDDGHFWDYQYQIHLDFYDDAMRTYFILKYMNNDQA
jgi:hypothetical protein